MSFCVKKGGNSISYQFCSFGYFKNFDSISISWIPDQKRRKLFFIPILLLWIFWKTLTALVYHGFRIKKGGNFFQTNFAHLDILENFDSISISWIPGEKRGKLFSYQF